MDLLSDILAALRLRGSLYFRTAFTAPWGIEVPEYRNVARFHFAHRGQCRVRVAGQEDPVLLAEGDLVIVPHGARHIIGEPESAPVAELDRVLEASGYQGEGALVYGGEGARPAGHKTELICGHFSLDAGVTHPLIAALPPILHLPADQHPERAWLDQTLSLIGAELTRPGLGAELVALKLSEAICIQAIRTWLDREGTDHPVASGFTDPRIRRVLDALHRDPACAWSLERMAEVAGQSRSAFAERFRKVMGEAPLGYLTRWRMLKARVLLSGSALPLIEVAERSGYRSEASFGRVFKGYFGCSPARLRRTALGSPGAD